MAIETPTDKLDSSTMDTMAEVTRPYLRDAAVCLVPCLTDEQVECIRSKIEQINPFALVRRLTRNTLLVEGIPIHAVSRHEAELATWDLVASHVRDMILESTDFQTQIVSIDVRDRNGALARRRRFRDSER